MGAVVFDDQGGQISERDKMLSAAGEKKKPGRRSSLRLTCATLMATISRAWTTPSGECCSKVF
jgi:hypothetical protein